MDKLLGKALFLLAVGPNLVLLAIGVLVGFAWLLVAAFRPKPKIVHEVEPRARPTRSMGVGAQVGIAMAIGLVLVGALVRGSHAFGQALFVLAVGPNLILLAYGVVRGVIWLAGAALSTMATPAHRHAHPDDAFHHPDPIATPAFEQLFMLAAIGLVVVGLPVALGAVFHFVLPLIGGGW